MVSGNDRGRPGQDAPTMVTTTNFKSVPPTTDSLWSLAETCPPGQLFALSLGYRLGLLERDGYRDGYIDAERDMAARWHRVFLDVHALAKRPTFAELRQRREVA